MTLLKSGKEAPANIEICAMLKEQSNERNSHRIYSKADIMLKEEANLILAEDYPAPELPEAFC